MCLFWRSPTAWSPESTSGDSVFNLAIAYSGKLEIGTRQLNNRRSHVLPDFLPICPPGALSTCLHYSRMPRHHTRPPGRYSWRDGKGRSLTKFLVNSPSGKVFLKSIDISKVIKNLNKCLNYYILWLKKLGRIMLCKLLLMMLLIFLQQEKC